MRNKKLLTALTMTLLLGLSACSNNKTNTDKVTPTPVITEAAPTEDAQPSKEALDNAVPETNETVNTEVPEANETVDTNVPDKDIETDSMTPAQEEAPVDEAPTTVDSSTEKKLSTYYENIGTLDDNYEFATSYIETITSKDQIANYAKEHNLTDYEVADCSGMECYLITPKYEGTTIKVELFSDYEHTKTENILDTEKPVFLLCNPSDIWSNAQITVSYDYKVYMFSPFVSLKDGTAILPENANPGM